jgi:hypothetical protein
MFKGKHLAFAGVLAVALAACSDEQPVAPSARQGEPVQVAGLDCRVIVATGAMGCSSPTDLGGASGLILGGQNVNVTLTASNHQYDPIGAVYSIDVTVKNLILQALGTTDGVTAHDDGVRVFFLDDPQASDGSGLPVASLAQETGIFLGGSPAPFYEYPQRLATGATSNPVTWQFSVPAGVASFSFKVYVAAPVQFPNGWVEVSPSTDTMEAGGTQPLTATVRNVVGTPLPGAPVTWGTTNPAVGTVDAAGVFTAVGAGATTITAVSGALSGSAALQVCPSLAVGGVYTATMPGASSVCFSGGASGAAEYTYMPVNLSNSSSLSLTLLGTGIVPVAGPPSPSLAPGGQLLGVSPALQREQDQRDDAHMAMLERDTRLGESLARRSDARVERRRSGPRMNIVSTVPAVGDLWSLNTAQGCGGARDDRTGRVVSIGNHVIIVADTTNPPGGFTQAQYDSIRLEFDTLAYPVDTTNFGGPTDLDENQRVVAFYTRAVNELSPPASSVITLGYFTARDLFSSEPTSCPRSNEGEMFYMMVPDPTGAVNSNVRTVSQVRGLTVGTMAHELQHLINASRRVYIVETPTFEEVWLNEGLSHIGEELLFYRTSVGLAPRGNIVVGNLTTGPNASRRVAAFNTYANPNFGRLRGWLQRPDTAGPIKNNDALAVRGAIWAFLRYSADRLNGTDSQLWFNLVNSETSGLANLQAAMGVDPLVWTRDFISAMYADDAVAGIGAAQQVTSWSFRSLYIALYTSYQLGPRPLTNGSPLTLSYSRGGGTAYARFGVPTGSFASLTALSGGVAPTSPYSLIVVRTK